MIKLWLAISGSVLALFVLFGTVEDDTTDHTKVPLWFAMPVWSIMVGACVAGCIALWKWALR
jgi:uncharacterized membrane protein YozB (DUF420 family)